MLTSTVGLTAAQQDQLDKGIPLGMSILTYIEKTSVDVSEMGGFVSNWRQMDTAEISWQKSEQEHKHKHLEGLHKYVHYSNSIRGRLSRYRFLVKFVGAVASIVVNVDSSGLTLYSN